MTKSSDINGSGKKKVALNYQELSNQELFEILFQSFFNGLRSFKSEAQRDFAKKLGLDILVLNIGYNSGQHFHRTEAAYDHAFLRTGFIWKSKKAQNKFRGKCHGQFGKNSLIFPLIDQDKNIVNFYGVEYKTQRQTKGFFNDKGCFPEYPSPKTEKLFITQNILDAATLYQSRNSLFENRDAVMASFDGELKPQIIQAIESLPMLKEIVFFKTPQSFPLKNEFGNITITEITLPKEKFLNDIWIEEGADAILAILSSRKAAEQSEGAEVDESSPVALKRPLVKTIEPKKDVPLYQLQKIAAQLIIYQTDLGLFEVTGFLPKKWDNLKVFISFKSNEGTTFRKEINLFDAQAVLEWSEEIGKAGISGNRFFADLDKLTNEVDNLRRVETQEPTKEKVKVSPNIITPTDRKKAMGILKSAHMLKRIDELIEKSGIIGEEAVRLTAWICASTCMNGTNKKIQMALQGSSGYGKSHILNGVAKCIPNERVKDYTRITNKALYHIQEGELTDVLVLFQDMDGIEKGSELAIRELVSYGQISIKSLAKDKDGNIQPIEKRVSGRFSSIGATTTFEITEDNENRSLVLTIDTSEEQTRRVVERQNAEAAGLVNFKEEKEAQELLKNVLRLLIPGDVVIPHAVNIKLPDEARSLRRLNKQFLTFISQIAWLNQFNRKRDDHGRIIAQREDIVEGINYFIGALMMKVDDLTGSLGQFFQELKKYINQRKNKDKNSRSFTKRDLRVDLHRSNSAVDRFVNKLEEMGYVQKQGGNKKAGMDYQLLDEPPKSKDAERIRNDLLSQIPK